VAATTEPAVSRRTLQTIARLSTRFELPLLDPAACWRRANRIVAARLTLALVRERLVDAELQGDALVVAGASLPLRRVRALELHEPELEQARAAMLDDPLLAWRELGGGIELQGDAHARIATELADGVPRLALALWVAELRAHAPAALARMRLAPPPRDGEDLVMIGHPWHPMVKTRLGLSWAENLRHAPELFAHTPIAAIELPRALVRVHGDAHELLAPVLGEAAHGQVRIPVHRAQLARLRSRLPPAILAAITLVPRASVRARSLLSLRTAALPEHDLHVKLALDIHTTSARRIVSPMSVANGPELSALLATIARADPLTSRGLALQPELGALGLEPASAGPNAGQLAAIVRDAGVLAGDTVVCAALGELDHDGTPVIERLLAGYPDPAPARAMWHDYLALLVPAGLRLWTAHGIALELHLQNTLVRLRGGRPIGFVARDLGGIRIHRPRLDRAGHPLVLDPASFIVTDDERAGAAKLTHSLFHAHLAAVIGVLADRGLAEPEAWAMLRACIEACLGEWSRAPALRGACDFDRAYLLADRIPAKALLRMRIADRSSAYSFVELANPIAAHGAGAPGSDRQ
jgi:siderophore synthetase component